MSLKRYIKTAGGALCGSSLLKPLVRSRMRNSVNVVYYHFIGGSTPHYDAFYAGCTPERFTRDLEQLSRVFSFAPLNEVIASREAGQSDARPRLAITFDDGFDLRQSGVMEILSRYGVQATTFVITSCIENQRLMWRHKISAIRSLASDKMCVSGYNLMAAREGFEPINSRSGLMEATSRWRMEKKDALATELWEYCQLQPLKEYLAAHRPYFGWAGLREWLSAGHSIGFHTHTHPYCSRLEEKELEAELIEPARGLKQKLGLKELFLSYPFGHRLSRPLEDKVFSGGLFTALFGIDGFRKKGTSNQHLERAGVEQDGVSWPVFAGSLIRSSAGVAG